MYFGVPFGSTIPLFPEKSEGSKFHHPPILSVVTGLLLAYFLINARDAN